MTLHDYITRHLRVPFCYGRLDCVLFAAGWVKEATGKDYLDAVPKWESARQAMRIVEQHGGLDAVLDARFIRIDPKLAKDGDLCIYNGSVCIFSGAHIVGPGSEGLQFIDRKEACLAWSL